MYMWRLTTTTTFLASRSSVFRVHHCYSQSTPLRQRPLPWTTAVALVHNNNADCEPPKKWLPRPPTRRRATPTCATGSDEEDQQVTKSLPSPPSKSTAIATAEVTKAASTTAAAASQSAISNHTQTHCQPATSTISPSLHVGIFVDLDNVAPASYTRVAASYLVEPLRMLVQQVLVNATVDKCEGWGNTHTNSFGGKYESGHLETTAYQAWDGTTAVTGYDAQGMLRCGVCGAKMKVTKKDVKRGLTPEIKLEKHMKMLHTREQQKRINRRRTSKKKKPLSDKEMEKFRKYQSAAVGVVRKSPQVNDLFQVLRERGMHCRVVQNVDQALIAGAKRWMTQQQQSKNATTTQSPQNQPQQGVLMVVSRDSDFVPLLVAARNKGLLVITVAPNALTQTKALIRHSDIVLEATTEPDLYEDANDVVFSKDTHTIHDVYSITARTALGKSVIQPEILHRLNPFSEVETDDDEEETEWNSDEDEDYDNEAWDSDYDADDEERWKSEYDLYGEEEWRNRYDLWGDEEGYWRPTP